MGHKKRNVAPRSKTSPPADGTGGGAVADEVVRSAVDTAELQGLNVGSPIQLQSKNDTSEFDALSYSAIKLECQRALTVLRRGNHTKALRLMKEMCVKHENSAYSALIHRVQGTVSVKVALIIDDPNAKQRHLKNAIESAKRAIELSPNSIEFSHFYANLLYEAANDGKEYEVVVQECERALAIENPVDPAKESLQDESQQKITTPDARILHVQNELRSVIQKSNIASISTWMKNLGNGDEKFRLIPIRRVSEDPMELRLVQARRPNEIKKATKTPEERRKEIEVRVAAARLLQQKSESPQSQNDRDKAMDLTSGSGQRVADRRKSGNARKVATSAEKRDWVQSYWNTMSLDKKKELLKITLYDLKAHFSSSKDALAIEVLSEALSFAEVNKTWKFWMCCRCNEKFADSESHMQHVVQEHMGNLLPKMQSVLPQNVENEWIEKILNCSWKPLDINAAVEMLERQSKLEASDFADEVLSRNDTEESKDCFTDSHRSGDELEMSSRTMRFGDSCNGNTFEGRDRHKVRDILWRDFEGNQACNSYLLPDSWPLSDDSERAKLLERIHAIFEVLIMHKYLAGSHLGKVIQFAVDELQCLASGSQLLNYGVGLSPACICFLGVHELKKIVKFLQELSHCCGLSRYSGKGNAIDDSNNGIHAIAFAEIIVFDEDVSSLLLDEHSLACSLTSTFTHNGTADDTASTISASGCCGNRVVIDADALLSWIFSGPTYGEELASWIHTKEERTHKGIEILQMLEKEFYHLQSFCEKKCEHLSYEEAIQAVEDHCLEECKKREHVTEFSHQSYESVLRRRQEELIENDNDLLISNRFELDAISIVLKGAESLNVNQFGFEGTYGGVASHMCDLESGEGDTWRTKDCLHQVDSSIEVAIQRQKEQLSNELSKIDARIMRNVTGMQQLEVKLQPASSYDYQAILLPLLKSFMRAHLEDQAEKDATEKSDAAREAFLAELALDPKTGIGGGSDHSRHIHERVKDKRKNKESRKTKDSKITSTNGLHMIQPETADEISPPVECYGDHPDYEIVAAGSGEVLDKHEEEFRHRIELQAEERKLEETLEYQRQIENEAKQKHLAEQHKKSVRQDLETAVTGLPGAYLKHNDDADVLERSNHCQKEPLMQKNGFSDSECVPRSRAALLNGNIPEDNNLSSNRQTGRKSKRNKHSVKLINGKHQPLSSEKENIGSQQVKSKDSQNDDPYLVENDTKTLRQLHAEDDEERFQEDLKKAVRQSLDTYHAHQKLPMKSNAMMPEKIFLEADDMAVLSDDVTMENINGVDVYGAGLKNEVGEYNCFINVIIQSLWHLTLFRDEFLRRSASEHAHVGDPCVTCALYDIFTALNMASTDNRREAVAPTSLRIALSNLYPDSNFFQEAQMNDASEVLGVLFDCLHQSFTSGSCVSDTESVESNCIGSWDCANNACIAHSLFGMDIFERMNCYNCGLESRHLKYTSFFHNINANSLRTMQAMFPESSFEELLNIVEMYHKLACDSEAGGCGKLNHIHRTLSNPPHVFITVLGWQNTCENADDISSTLAAMATQIDINVIYHGLDPKNTLFLVSVVCYYGQHYHCFAYSHGHEQWVMYDDKTVKVIGGWDDVLTMCGRGHLQPQVLFFEAVN